MSLPDVMREMNRTTDRHVFAVLMDFFGGNPPEDEINRVVNLIEEQARAFGAVKAAMVTEATAPEEPKKE